MDHSEALQTMAAERYLLGELPPETRDAFEAHFFDCEECALDLRAGAAFVAEAKSQLPQLEQSTLTHRPNLFHRLLQGWQSLFSHWQASFAAPAFAMLLAVVAYQNLATIPALREASSRPVLLPWATLHIGTRGSAHASVMADRRYGLVLLIDLPDVSAYRTFAFQLADEKGKLFWTTNATAPPDDGSGTTPFSLLIPGSGLQQGSYTLTMTGITAEGQRVQLDRRALDIRFTD